LLNTLEGRHRKPMTPWYRLPALHASIYGDEDAAAAAAAKKATGRHAPSVQTCRQLLPFRTLAATWLGNRLRRVLEEDYGVVAKGTSEDRAAHFVGSLSVSFLTVCCEPDGWVVMHETYGGARAAPRVCACSLACFC
jgi:hypothetical protein